MEIDKINKSQ